MKSIFKITLFTLFFILLFFISCTTDPDDGVTKPVVSGFPPTTPIHNPYIPTPPLPPYKDSLSGREFIFNDLIWEINSGLSLGIEIPESGSFCHRGIEVFILSASDTIVVPFYYTEWGFGGLSMRTYLSFIYDNDYYDSLYLFAVGDKRKQLIGTRVSVKVKIL